MLAEINTEYVIRQTYPDGTSDVLPKTYELGHACAIASDINFVSRTVTASVEPFENNEGDEG